MIFMAHADYIFMVHANLANLTDGKSLRPCLSAAPSACLAHAETAESADFASRYALAAIRDVYTRRNADSCER